MEVMLIVEGMLGNRVSESLYIRILVLFWNNLHTRAIVISAANGKLVHRQLRTFRILGFPDFQPEAIQWAIR